MFRKILLFATALLLWAAVPVLAHRLTVRLQRAVSKDVKFLSKRDMAEQLVKKILEEVPCPTEDFSR